MTLHTAGDPMETVDYVRSMLKQLQEMARGEGNDMLSYLIEMAHIEANDIVRGVRPSKLAVDKGDSAA